MGRNFVSVCHYCGEQLMHLRGKEGDLMQRFANDHYEHKENTEVLDDYVKEPPESYEDVWDKYHTEGNDLVASDSDTKNSPSNPPNPAINKIKEGLS
jgi:hypothetical protein